MSGEITNYIVAVLLFGIFLSGVTTFYGDVTGNYNVTSVQNISGISQENAFINKSKEMAASVKSNTEEGGTSDLGFTGFMAPIQLILDTPGLIASLITGGLEIINVYIPIGFVEAGLIAIVTVIIGLGILGVLLKREI